MNFYNNITYTYFKSQCILFCSVWVQSLINNSFYITSPAYSIFFPSTVQRIICQSLANEFLILPIKCLHGGVAGLADAFGLDEFLEGDGDDFQVSYQGHMIHIPDVQFEFLCPTNSITAMTLSPSANTRSYIMSSGLLSRIEWHVLNQEGPGAN